MDLNGVSTKIKIQLTTSKKAEMGAENFEIFNGDCSIFENDLIKLEQSYKGIFNELYIQLNQSGFVTLDKFTEELIKLFSVKLQVEEVMEYISFVIRNLTFTKEDYLIVIVTSVALK